MLTDASYRARGAVERPGSDLLLAPWDLASRIIKHVLTDRGGLVLAAVMLWLSEEETGFK